MRVFTQKVPRVAGEGYVARLQFTREEGFEDCVVSAALLHEERALPRESRIYVQTLERDGTLIDSVALEHNGVGGAQVGLHVLRVGRVKRFQVVVLAYGADVVTGSLTAMHGVTTEASSLLKSSIEAAGGVPRPVVVEQAETIAAGGCKVPEEFRRDIIPLFGRGTLYQNYQSYLPGVTLPPDGSCHGGVQIIR